LVDIQAGFGKDTKTVISKTKGLSIALGVIALVIFVVLVFFVMRMALDTQYKAGCKVCTSELQAKLIQANADKALVERELRQTYEKLNDADRASEFSRVFQQPEGTLCQRCGKLCPDTAGPESGYSDFESGAVIPLGGQQSEGNMYLCEGLEGEKLINCYLYLEGVTDD
jgi:Pyruvate/2-oxoacid:ferredoxin oxidoreductase delta subunit